MNSSAKVNVIYLFYFPYQQTMFKSFLNSYMSFPAGIDHEITVVFKGMKSDDEAEIYIRMLNEAGLKHNKLFYYGTGYDIDAYLWAASQAGNEYLFFLNTSSIILKANWLKYYFDNFSDDTGVISATGSFQSHYSTVFINNNLLWDFKKSVNENYKKYKLLLKAFFYWRFVVSPFPNPHIRTNAFLIKRELLLSLKFKPIKRKFEALLFESGRNGFTNQIFKKGLKALVVDNKGQAYEKNDWPESFTFCRGIQENLLISDNQTSDYLNADTETKKKMSFIAWGKI